MLRPDQDLTIPEETERVAKAAFPKGNVYMRIREVEIGFFDAKSQLGSGECWTVGAASSA